MTELNPLDDVVDTSEPQSARGISPILVIFLITGALGFFAAAVMLFAEPGGARLDERDLLVPAQGRDRDWQAADFALTRLDGATVNLADYAGRPVFINLWRTDCPPCVRELPAMQEFARQQAGDGAVVIAINQGERADEISGFLDELGIVAATESTDGIIILLDPGLLTGEDYPYQALPTTYILAEDHQVRYTKIGEVDLEGMYLYLEAVQPGSRG